MARAARLLPGRRARREAALILVVAGLHELPFDRLIRAAALLGEGEELVVQRGSSRVEVPGASTFESLGAERLGAAYRRARVVIGQASPGVLFDALDAGKQPILVPRRAHLGEHVDDHQLEFARFVADRAVIVEEVAELPERVRTWDVEAHCVEGGGIDAAAVRRVGDIVEAAARRGRVRATIRSLLLRGKTRP